MALIEYQITYVKGKAKVTSQVVEVDKGDRLRFKSNAPVGIKYKRRSPFKDSKAPQPNQIFPVNSTTATFEVANPSTSTRPMHFDCGPPPPQKRTPIEPAYVKNPGGPWKPWGTGGDTPPGKG
jgi:hypothetical protein